MSTHRSWRTALTAEICIKRYSFESPNHRGIRVPRFAGFEQCVRTTNVSYLLLLLHVNPISSNNRCLVGLSLPAFLSCRWFTTHTPRLGSSLYLTGTSQLPVLDLNSNNAEYRASQVCVLAVLLATHVNPASSKSFTRVGCNDPRL